MEPVSPASVGGFFTIGPPGKSPTSPILFKDCSSRIPVGLPGGNTEIKVSGMKYRLHSCSWSWSHTDSHHLFPPRSILDFPQLPPVQVSVDHIAGPHHRRGWAPGHYVLPRPRWAHVCIYHHSWGRERKRQARRSLDATHIPPCPLWCLLVSRSSASTQWELISCITFSGAEEIWSAQAAATACSSKGFLLCPFFPPPWRSPARQYGHMTHCTTAELAAEPFPASGTTQS